MSSPQIFFYNFSLAYWIFTICVYVLNFVGLYLSPGRYPNKHMIAANEVSLWSLSFMPFRGARAQIIAETIQPEVNLIFFLFCSCFHLHATWPEHVF